MQNTQLKELLSFLETREQQETDKSVILELKMIQLKIYSMLIDERKQIESAFNSGKNFIGLECDGDKYYFMNYISND